MVAVSTKHTKHIVYKKYNPFSEFDSVKEIWTTLLKKCPHSYYLSWAWTEIWLQSLPQDCKLHLVVGLKKESPVIAFFVGSRTNTRHKFFQFRQLSLNQTLLQYFDSVYIEYNAILIDPEITVSLESLLEDLPIKLWDEFRMIRCSSIYQPNLMLNNNLCKKYILNIEQQKSYYVDLEKVRRNNNDYLALISPKKRYQIRRSLKEYEKIGETRILIAENVEDALKFFDELIELHQQRWTERGHQGVFSNEYVVDFNKNLISSRFVYGEIQLIKISAGAQTLGCLYSLIYDRKVYGGLCGFNYLRGHLFSPGLISHYFAVLHNTGLGLSSYDFMDGEDKYKESLATDYNEIQTIVVQKNNIKYKVEQLIKKLRHLYQTKK